MRRLALVFIAFLAATLCSAQVFERTYLSSDKSVYVAGDRIWLSAFCMDLGTGKLSEMSRIAYVELVSSQGIALTGKIDLESGRGAGYIDIPFSLPTGNYELVAFTALNKNEKGYDFLKAAKPVSIFNTATSEKLPKGVEMVEKLPSASQIPISDGILAMSAKAEGDSITVALVNTTSKALTYSLSLWNDDGLGQMNPVFFKSAARETAAGRQYIENVQPEYEGEIICADICGKDSDKVKSEPDLVAGYISTIGVANDIYVGKIDASGAMCFKTGNIYGNKDLVCEVDKDGENIEAHLEVRTPFVSLAPSLPTLKLSLDQIDRLSARTRSMKQAKQADTLYELMPRREDLLLRSDASHVYLSDDYTRFTTIREVLTEYVQEARVRGRKDRQRIEVLAVDASGNVTYSSKSSLVMFNGVPIFKHEKMLDYDAMLVKKIEVWQRPYFFGTKIYDGAINFVTDLEDSAYMDFGSNVRIVDFVGAAYPMQLTQPYCKDEKDLRQTVIWKPLESLDSEGNTSLKFSKPSYSGTFRIVIEGVDSDGNPFAESCTVE